jgi:outer membrane protein assembly factor BamB
VGPNRPDRPTEFPQNRTFTGFLTPFARAVRSATIIFTGTKFIFYLCDNDTMSEVTPEAQPELSSAPLRELKPMRTWPAMILVLLMLVLKFLPSLVDNGPAMLWMASGFGPMLCALGIVLWWIVLSRTPFLERLMGLVGLVGITTVVLFLSHESMRGPASFMLTIPAGFGTFAVSSSMVRKQVTTRRTGWSLAIAAVVLGCSLGLRAEGVWGNFDVGLQFRWTPTVEDLLTAETETQEVTVSALEAEAWTAALNEPIWPGYRGPQRNGSVSGVSIDPDWKASPPKEVWRRPVGPAWSSFAVAGDMIFTQEQRGPSEVVTCYNLASGKPHWIYEITSRFDDPLGGPGPRATPTLDQGQLFALGASGHLLCLDPGTGEEIWTTDLREIAQRSPPMWGFSSSPLVTDNSVIVHAAGDKDLGIIAFDRQTGAKVWSRKCGEMSYSSPHLAQLLGRAVVLLLSDEGLHMYDADLGEEILTYEWSYEGYRALQPHVIGQDQLLIPTGLGTGTRLIQLSENDQGAWDAQEKWTSLKLKPDFNDLVVHQGFIYGFDVGIFTCINLETGQTQWKKGRYGKGQVILAADSGSLIVVTETGDVKLLAANPNEFQELGSVPAMSAKTWNHPVLVGDRLLVRNAEEAVCYQLATTAQSSAGQSNDAPSKPRVSKEQPDSPADEPEGPSN